MPCPGCLQSLQITVLDKPSVARDPVFGLDFWCPTTASCEEAP
jgi:hypothetical protein|eukprot:COSAG01_NODE_5577_length_4171_cov_19.212426_4_plen_43_part_00